MSGISAKCGLLCYPCTGAYSSSSSSSGTAAIALHCLLLPHPEPTMVGSCGEAIRARSAEEAVYRCPGDPRRLRACQ